MSMDNNTATICGSPKTESRTARTVQRMGRKAGCPPGLHLGFVLVVLVVLAVLAGLLA